MKIIFLAPYPLKTAPSQRFRFEHFMPIMAERGHTVDFQGFLDAKGWKILYAPGNVVGKMLAILRGLTRRVMLLFRLHAYDVVFLHREAAPLGPPLLEWIMAKWLKKPIIYDYDDAIWLPNTSEENKVAAKLKWHHKVADICRWAHTVSAGNDFLADYARQYNKRVVVMPTVVDTEVHRASSTRARNQKLVIGWTGSHSTLGYLDALVPIISELEKEYSFDFLVIADKDPQLPLASFTFLKWQKATEIADLARIDIGIMPLKDDNWAKGKCGFKAIQYLALGIPAVVSPVGVNAQIVTHGISGYLCSTDEEWRSALTQLLASAELRNSFGKAGIEKISDYYSVKSQIKPFFQLFGI